MVESVKLAGEFEGKEDSSGVLTVLEEVETGFELISGLKADDEEDLENRLNLASVDVAPVACCNESGSSEGILVSRVNDFDQGVTAELG